MGGFSAKGGPSGETRIPGSLLLKQARYQLRYTQLWNFLIVVKYGVNTGFDQFPARGKTLSALVSQSLPGFWGSATRTIASRFQRIDQIDISQSVCIHLALQRLVSLARMDENGAVFLSGVDTSYQLVDKRGRKKAAVVGRENSGHGVFFFQLFQAAAVLCKRSALSEHDPDAPRNVVSGENRSGQMVVEDHAAPGVTGQRNYFADSSAE